MQRLQRTLGLTSRPQNRAVSTLVLSLALASGLAACGGDEEPAVAENEISVE